MAAGIKSQLRDAESTAESRVTHVRSQVQKKRQQIKAGLTSPWLLAGAFFAGFMLMRSREKVPHEEVSTASSVNRVIPDWPFRLASSVATDLFWNWWKNTPSQSEETSSGSGTNTQK